MSGLDYFIGNNFGYAQGREQAIAEADANMAEAQAIIDAQAAENRRLMQRLRDKDLELEQRLFRQNLIAKRALALADELRKHNPNASILSPNARAEMRRRHAHELLNDPKHGPGPGFVYDEIEDTIRPARRG